MLRKHTEKKGERKVIIFIILFLVIGSIFSINFQTFFSVFSKLAGIPSGQSGLVSWGLDKSGALGKDDTRVSPPPAYFNVHLPKTIEIRDITAGVSHSLALDKDGVVWVWGSNQYGQLGINSSIKHKSIPMQVQDLPKIKKIAANQHHSLALTEDGKIFAWGLNLSGQLGIGTQNDSNIPVQVLGLSAIKDIAAGYRFSMALKDDGTVWAWGALCRQKETQELRELLSQFSDNISLVGGYYDPANSDITSLSETNNCVNEDVVNIKSLTPIQITGLNNVEAISAGFGHMLALKTDGTVWTWGCNTYGQVGNGKIGTSNNRIPAQVKNLTDVISISAGYRHSLALKSDGTVWAWGHNAFGELGDGSQNDNPTPSQIQTLKNIRAVSAGFDYSLALDTNNLLWGWGQTMYGQLGKSEGSNMQVLPAINTRFKNIQKVAAGGGHVLAIPMK